MEENQMIGAKKLVALTFDDGPTKDITPLILDILQKNEVKATFFVCGSNIGEDTKEIMQRQINLGCEIANHSWSHPYMDQMEIEEIKKEISNTNHIILEHFGITPKFFRPPYIATKQEMFEVIDLPFVNGIACADWEAEIDAKSRASTIINNAKDGDIVLLHDFSGNYNTVEALGNIISALKQKGFDFVTVSELFQLNGINPLVKNRLWTNVFQTI